MPDPIPNPTREAYDRCFKKRLFFEVAAAEAHMHWLWQMQGVSGTEVYECQIGHAETHYHVGHPPLLEDKRVRLTRLRTFGNETVQTRP